MTLQSYLSEKRGRQAKLAKDLDISPAFMYQIARGDRPVPVEYCALIEESTNGVVTRKMLRPNDWVKIWPELAE